MTEFNKLQPKQVLSETQFYLVEKIVGDKVQLSTEIGKPIVVDKGYVETLLVSADQYSKTEKVTRTDLTEVFFANPYIAMTVNFNKQVKEADVATEIQQAYENSTPKEFTSRMKKALKKGLNGEERTMAGRHYGSKDEYGRVRFINMGVDRDESKKDYDTRQRLVDPRTLNWLILKGVKYEVK